MREAGDQDLMKWMRGVAFGRTVLLDKGDAASFDRYRMKPAIGHSHDFWFGAKFAAKHPSLVAVAKDLAGRPGSKWNVRPSAPLQGKEPLRRQCREISSSEDFRRLVESMQVRVTRPS